jgi:hypothetical protein
MIDDTTKDADQATLWCLAANCSLYEEDPQPRRRNIGSVSEELLVSPREKWRSYYSRHLAHHLAADPDRIRQARTWAQTNREVAQPRERGSNAFGRQDWDLAVDLCDRALAIVTQSGADTDPYTRRRLLAGLNAALTTETIGIFPGVAAFQAEELQIELAAIDEDERRGT